MTTGILNSIQAQTGTQIQNALVAAQIGSVNVTGIAQSSSTTDFQFLGSSAFQAPTTGTYTIVAFFDSNGSGARGGRGSFWSETLDYSRARVRLYDQETGGNLIYSEQSGGEGAWYWTDYVTNGLISLDIGQIYRLEFGWVNYTESVPGTTADVTVGWQALSFKE